MKRLALALGLAATLATSPAEARVQRDVRYRYEQVWNALVRLLRVDYRFPVDESDRENGFVLFRFREYGREHAGSVELVRAEGDDQVRLIVQIESVPTDTEARVADALESKLRSDYGAPREVARAEGDRAPLVPRLSPRRVDDYQDPPAAAEPQPPPGDGPPSGGRSPDSPAPGAPPRDDTVSPSEAQPEFPPPSSRRRRR